MGETVIDEWQILEALGYGARLSSNQYPSAVSIACPYKGISSQSLKVG